MRTVLVELGARSYPVHIGRALLERAGELLKPHLADSRLLLVSDSQVAPLYLERAAAGLRRGGFAVEETVIAAGEASKALAGYGLLLERLAAGGFERRDAVVALGGGMVSDLAGFAAATYHRGIALAILPTTLLAMADASIGGKVAVNLPQGKNQVGAFHQPRAVIADLETLQTLSVEQIAAGLAEIIKVAILFDADLFAAIERSRRELLAPELELYPHLLVRAVGLKAAVVARDERETGERALLNLGHTFAHGLEAAGNWTRLSHGAAVLLGLIAAARLAHSLGLLKPADQDRIERLATALLSVCHPGAIDFARAETAMTADKKAEFGRLRFILPHAIGRAEVHADVPAAAARETLQSLQPFLIS